jgi:hypothetical protein
MDRRKFLGTALKLADGQAKQAVIKNVLPKLPIQIKRAGLDLADAATTSLTNPTMGRREFLGRMASKLKVRQNPVNKRESIIHGVENMVDIAKTLKGKGLFSHM